MRDGTARQAAIAPQGSSPAMAAAGGAPFPIVGISLLLITAFAWGLNWPVLKLLMRDWPPFTFRVLGAAAAIIVLVLVAWRAGDALWPAAGQWRRLTVASVLNVTSWGGIAPLALMWLDAAEAAILAYTMPVWAMLLAWPILGERPTAARLAGLACGLSGMALLMAGPALDRVAAVDTQVWLAEEFPGLIAILVTAVMFAGGTVVTKRYPIAMAPVPLVAWQLAIGMVPVAVMAAALEPPVAIDQITWLGWGCIAYVGLIAQCLAYLAWFRALKQLPASTATIGSLLAPVIGVLGSGMMLGEPLEWRHAVALMLTLAGMMLATRG